MTKLSEALASGAYCVTSELTPPKGTNLEPAFSRVRQLRDVVTAFNLTDSAAASMAMSPTAVAHLLQDQGIETILQFTCRDRNRLALQADLLAASALGMSNLLCMAGDRPGVGDHPEAAAVFDLGAIELLNAITALMSGRDLAGNELDGAPSFFVGAVANPGAKDLGREIARVGEKIEAGARFFQTQGVYDVPGFERFMRAFEQYKTPLLAGFIVLKSGAMGRRLNATLPGVNVPEAILTELDTAPDRVDTAVRIAGRIIGEIAPMCQGIHIMTTGWESHVPRMLELAGLRG